MEENRIKRQHKEERREKKNTLENRKAAHLRGDLRISKTPKTNIPIFMAPIYAAPAAVTRTEVKQDKTHLSVDYVSS